MGLKFNPYNNFGVQDNTMTPVDQDLLDENPSVPVVADDYYNTQIPALSSTLPINWKPEEYGKAWNTVNTPVEEVEKNSWLTAYDKWNKGFSALDEDEREEWERQNAQKIAGKSDEWKERLWKNQRFVDAFGMDVFKSYDKEERDKMYDTALTRAALEERYGTNDNYDTLKTLTPEGQKELMESGYKSDTQLKAEKMEDKDLDEYSSKERLKAGWELAKSSAATGKAIGGLVGSVSGAFAGPLGMIIGPIAGAATGAGIGAIVGLSAASVNPDLAKGQIANNAKKENDELLNKIVVADNERAKEDSKEEIDDLYDKYIDEFNSGIYKEDQINESFDSIALNGKRTVTDEFGHTDVYDHKGSNYYTMFKDTDIFENFDLEDKLKYLAQYQELSSKYGVNKALSILEQDMQNYVSDEQTAKDWAINTAWSIWTGGVANLANNLVGIGALCAYLGYGSEGLANYLQGKDASGNGEDNSRIFDPQYWEKVDKYNTFKRRNHAKADANGGIGLHTNIIKAGDEGEVFSWNTANEALKMSKFAWSDLIKVRGLGALAKVASLGAGNVAAALKASEAAIARTAQTTQELGALATLGASSIGIDVAYGMQTFNEVLEENNRKLDAIIDKDTDNAIKRRLADPATLKDFQRYVDAENKERQANAGEKGNWIPVDEEKAFSDYIAWITKQERQKQEELHAEDRQEALNSAADAYATDATIEFLRMSATNASFKNYLFDKGTLKALKMNNPYLDTTTKDGLYAVGKYAKTKYIAGTIATNIFGGFHSNYYDDVTVGFAKAFELQDYNNYLLDKYNPATYGSVLDNFVNPFLAGMSGIAEASVDPRSLYDGAIGALGVPVTTALKVSNLLHPKKAFKEMSESLEADKKAGIETDGISWTEYASHFISNPILEAFAQANEVDRATRREIATRNKIMKENKTAFEDMGGTIAALNQKEAVRSGQSVMEAEDAKNKQAYNLAKSILDMRNSPVVANAVEDVEKANWSKKKKFANAFAQVFNQALGINALPTAESSYAKAMQTLDDAVNIDNPEDEEAAARQEDLIKTFLGRQENQSIIKDMSDEEKQAFAKERLKKNAQSLIDTIKKINEVRSNFDNTISKFGSEIDDQLIYQYVMSDRWEQRANELDKRFTDVAGIESSEDIQENSGITMAAKYGSKAGFERALNAQKKRVEKAEEEAEKAKQAYDNHRDNPRLSREINDNNLMLKALNYTTENDNLQREKVALNELNKTSEYFESVQEVPIISARSILALNSKDRLRMLDDYYRDDYSVEQQKEIDKAKDMMTKNGTPVTEVMQWANDAALLRQRVEDNARVADRITKNPMAARALQKAAERNRKNAIFDYFSDKIVSKALLDLEKDSTTKDKVAAKARKYSSAVLDGIAKILKDVKKSSDSERMDDKTIKVIEEGINAVREERSKQLEENREIAKYLARTDKVSHTETRDVLVASEGGTPTIIGEQITEDLELSENDKNLVGTLLDYMGEKKIPLDKAAETARSEGFQEYFNDTNHNNDLKDRMTPASPDYIAGLFDDVLSAYRKYDEQRKKDAEEKKTNDTPESVVTPTPPTPVTPQPQKPEPKKDTSSLEDEVPQSETTEGFTTDDIVKTALNSTNYPIASEIGKLLDKLDELKENFADQETKDFVREIIKDLLDNQSFDDIKDFQDRLILEGISFPEVSQVLDYLGKLRIVQSTKTDTKAQQKADRDADTAEKSRAGNNVLSSMDLDVFLNDDKYEVIANYIKNHNMVPFLQKLGKLRHEDSERANKSEKLTDGPLIHFIYDPVLAAAVQKSIEDSRGRYEESDAPIIMVYQITDKNRRALFGDQNLDEIDSLIKIEAFDDGSKTWYFQPIGIMPGNNNESEDNIQTAQKMSKIRDAIDLTKLEDPKTKDQVQLLRYMNAAGTSRTGGAIKTDLLIVESHAEDGKGINTDVVRNTLELFEENAENPEESIIEGVTKKDSDEYKSKKQSWLKFPGKETFKNFINTDLYKKFKETFIERLLKEPYSVEKLGLIKEYKGLTFPLNKGSRTDFSVPVWIKPIGETTHRWNPKITIKSLLQAVDLNGNLSSAADNLMESNSRFTRLFESLGEVRLGNDVDAVTNLEKDIKHAIDNFLNIPNLRVEVKVTTEDSEFDNIPRKIVTATIYSKDKALSELKFDSQTIPSKESIAIMLKNLILDDNGEIRMKSSEYELIKWQVFYNDVVKAKPDSGERPDVIKAARTNLENIFDDGILTIKSNKLNYPVNRVTANIGGLMASKLYSDRPAPKTELPVPTGKNPVTVAETKTGEKIDPDTGIVIGSEKPSSSGETLAESGVPENVLQAVRTIIDDAHNRPLTEDEKHYSIGGKLWARITSIKHAIPGVGRERFNEQNAWGVPSTTLGDGFDEFGRDFFNGVFDSIGKGLSNEERMNLLKQKFEEYSNSTIANWSDVYTKLQELRARLISNDEHIIETGKDVGKDTYQPGKITLKGVLNVKMPDGSTRQVRVAGTIDMATIDKDGNIRLYDFKTHRSEVLNEESAKEKGYDTQLSLYAAFLEQELRELGIDNAKVAGIYLIPAKVKYDTPKGLDNKGQQIKGAVSEYKKSDRFPNQLLYRKATAKADAPFMEFHDANYQVEQEFPLTRLSNEQLQTVYDMMTEDERQAILEEVQDQMPNPEEAPRTTKDIEVSPKIDEKEEEEDDPEIIGRRKISNSFKGMRNRTTLSESQQKVVSDSEAAHAINPEESLQSKIDQIKEDCGTA